MRKRLAQESKRNGSARCIRERGATAIDRGIDAILTTDRAFDGIDALERIDPTNKMSGIRGCRLVRLAQTGLGQKKAGHLCPAFSVSGAGPVRALRGSTQPTKLT